MLYMTVRILQAWLGGPVRRDVALVSLVAACGVAVGACSGSGSGAGAGPTETFSESPLAEFYRAVYSRESDLDEDAQFRRVEDLKAECMKEQGCEYLPWYPEEPDAAVSPVLEDPIEDARLHGYGTFTTDVPVGQELVDPNEAITSAMSETERAAYDAALYRGSPGPSPSADGEDDLSDPNLVGCDAWAWDALYGPVPEEIRTVQEDPRYVEIDQAVSDITAKIASSPDLARLNEAWSECMAKEGFDYLSPDEAVAEFYRLQIDLSIEYENEGVPESESVLAEHREDEIATAVADQTCRKDVGYEDELIQIQYRLESDVATRYEDSIAELTTLMETTPDTP